METINYNEYKKSSRSYYITNKEEKMKDPVTGGDYIKEKEMYIRYHNLTEDEANLVMATNSYKERDAIFSDVIQKRKTT